MSVRFIPHDYEKHEECGIVAIYSKKGLDVAPYLYRSLVSLQHRGQDASGFVIRNENGLIARRGLGLVNEIFNDKDIELKGLMGIGHTRYPTTGRCLIQDVQPSVIGSISVTHNGHLANYDALRSMLEKEGYSFKGTVDSEPIALLIDSQLRKGRTIEGAIAYIMRTIDGAYSDAALI